MIARCADRSDVAAAQRFGRERGTEIGVRCGGHSVVGLPMADDALLIDLGAMNGVRVDPQCRRAAVQGGALLGALDVAAQRYGLATTAGNVSHTGVGGLTLGGGMGWLARRFGLACDNVVRFEVVTAEGEVVRASEAENPELFWALRGGGGNFGVVTEFEFQLHPIGTETLIADLYVEPQHAAAALRGWRELIAEAPRQATLTAWIGRSRDWPHLPPALRNQRLASIGYVWVGDPEQGRALLPALRAAATPVAERVTELSYLQLQQMDDDRQGHRRRRYWKGHYFRALSDEAIDTLVFPRCDSDSPFHPTVSLQSYGGAISDVPDNATAFSHRDVQMEFVAATSWVDPAEDANGWPRPGSSQPNSRALPAALT
jgi:FAD/FMN-containing dehydrogenase